MTVNTKDEVKTKNRPQVQRTIAKVPPKQNLKNVPKISTTITPSLITSNKPQRNVITPRLKNVIPSKPITTTTSAPIRTASPQPRSSSQRTQVEKTQSRRPQLRSSTPTPSSRKYNDLDSSKHTRSSSSSRSSPTWFNRSSSPRTESTSSRTESTLAPDEAAAAADLHDAVERISANNYLLQAEMERTRGELAAMAEACKTAQASYQNSQGVIGKLKEEIENLRIARDKAEKELGRLQTRILDISQRNGLRDVTNVDEILTLWEHELQQSETGEGPIAKRQTAEALKEMRKLRITLAESQKQLAECASRCCEWQQAAIKAQGYRKQAEKERDVAKYESEKLKQKCQITQDALNKDNEQMAQLRMKVALLETQHSQMGNDLRNARAHLRQLQVEMEVRDEREANIMAHRVPSELIAKSRANLQAEEILQRTHIEAAQASAWNLMVNDLMPALSRRCQMISMLRK